MGKIKELIHECIYLLIRLYQYAISPFFGPCCRFFPTCSNYSLEAIQQYGIFQGLYLSSRRLLRCHPWCQGGFDPLPEKRPHVN